ncbi:glycosyltransferase [Aestuariivirga sp.]|uniref:glycosyltransferase n=1 Tax=Aestuariivirga sp. TaxID=2650926 RepID=UPI0039E31376
MSILYFSPFPSHPDNHGNQATIQSFGRHFLKLGHRVHFALLKSPIYDQAALQAMRREWDTLDLLPNSKKLWADGALIPFDGWYQPGLGENIRKLCIRYNIDVVLCSYVFQSKLLEYVPPHVLKVIDTHDKMGNRYEMLRANGQKVEFFSCTPEEEGTYLARADIVLARRMEEARYFDQVTRRKTALVLPHVEEPRYIRKPRSELRCVGVVASANRINLAILVELLTELKMRFGKNCPFTLIVAGQVGDLLHELPNKQRQLFSFPWVRMPGYIKDIAAFYESVDLVLSPVTMGTGINVKTVQAMAFGMPLLTTRVGIKGIETDEPMHNHETIAGLVKSILSVRRCPEVLQRLADVSVSRYQRLLNDAGISIRTILDHPKLSKIEGNNE